MKNHHFPHHFPPVVIDPSSQSQSQCCFLLGTYRIIQGALGATRNLSGWDATADHQRWMIQLDWIRRLVKKKRACEVKNHYLYRQNHQTQWVIFHSTYMIFILNYQSHFTISWKSTTTHPALNPLPNHASCFAVINHHHWWSRYLWGGYPNTSITMVLMVIKGAHPIWDGMNFWSWLCNKEVDPLVAVNRLRPKDTIFGAKTLPGSGIAMDLQHVVCSVAWWSRWPSKPCFGSPDLKQYDVCDRNRSLRVQAATFSARFALPLHGRNQRWFLSSRSLPWSHGLHG